MTIIKKKMYSTTEEENTSIIITEFDAVSASRFMESMFQLESDPHLSDIFIYVTTYGGQILALHSMIETIRSSKKNVHLAVIGEASSCGGYLVITGPKGNRWMAPNSYILLHEIRHETYGTVSDIKQMSKHLEIQQDQIFRMVADNSLLTVEKLKEKLKDNDGEWLIQPEEALNLKLIDKIGVPRIKVSTIWEYDE